ncbi:aminotransferase class I/II-fold pyridoxal phosphate-dependent enzyme [Evansella sp. AB-P1]|uniref:aminotransferase class I/II-fold pyridoxal phosphate-dependent enzyme n=1 Tax=Evansella sp. AB-P1 TaxID=3037653 RepID=UPI00241F866D|nr:aminotransferase class I/II-fold pyridoxal phosphate-dependent enzyme [Evansella sp. AB-P1]MDG5789959.1 aminotransferase class I/II-fold pyridoxal phosphate-dependent enzyme [Evansella sp. AB-P1]
MDQSKTPIYSALVKHRNKENISFHVPGHKNGSVFFETAKELYKNILEIDVTEISGMDDLHYPTGIIKDAQQLTAHLYGSKSSYFLVGGSTVGNLAMIMSMVGTGDQILIQRNSHQSVFHAVELSGAMAIYLEPEIDIETGLSLGVSISVLKEAISRYPNAKAIVLTNPTYEGYGQSLYKHVKIAHEANIYIFVDEAHGAHLLVEDNRWPMSAMKAGADIVVHSAHKMLPAMTMSSFLHINSERIDENKVRQYLKMLQSSSPSYPLMASLDVARAYLAKMVSDGCEKVTNELMELKKELMEGETWHLAPPIIGDYRQDPLKLTFLTKGNASAYEWQENFESYGMYPELVTPNHLILTLPFSIEGIANTRKLCNDIKTCLFIQNFLEAGVKLSNIIYNKQHISEPILSLEELNKVSKKHVYLEESLGEIAAETVTPYPPGVPLILRGEEIQSFHIEKLKFLKNNDVYFQTGDLWKEIGICVVNYSR